MTLPTAPLDHGPWIDIHAHPGACFLRGIPPEHAGHIQFGGDRSVKAINRMRDGEVTVASFATVSDAHVIGLTPDGRLGALRDFEPGEALASHERQVRAIAGLTRSTAYEAVLEPDDVQRLYLHGEMGIWLTCEGGDFVETTVERVEQSYSMGVRSITLVHYRLNSLGDIQTEDEHHGGLTAVGRDVVNEMNRLGMVVDLAHATMRTTADAAEQSTRPIMVSHSHLASPGADHPRLLTVEHAKLVAATGGVVGAWPAGIVCKSLDDYATEVCRLVDAIGINHVAVGTDLDANFMPVLTEYVQFHELATLLNGRGMTTQEIDAVLGGNFLRMWRTVAG